MDLYATILKAIDPKTGELASYMGPNVPGISFEDAQHYCDTNGLGYCQVYGLLVAEIPCKKGTNEPDWDNRIDYDSPRLN